MEFGLLGPLMVRSGGIVVPVPAARQRVVLAALLLGANQVVPAEELADLLWGDCPPPTARVTVQNYVKRLRQALSAAGRSPIMTQPGGYQIRLGAEELDITRFETLQQRARDAARRGEWPVASARLNRALALWRGAPLADVPCDRLAVREVPRLDEMRVQALEARVDADLHLGLHGEVLGELGQLVAAYPLRERLRALLMVALYRAGRRGDALAAYREGRRVLVRDLRVEPGPELHRLHQQIVTADTGLAVGSSGGDGHVADTAVPVAPGQLPAGPAHVANRRGVTGTADGVVVRVLGPVEARADGTWVAGPPQRRLVLAVLALRAGMVVPVGELIDALWGDRPPRSAQGSVSALVTGLRQVLADLPGRGVERCGGGYRLQVEPDQVDVQRFRSLSRAGREAKDRRAALVAFDQALALWRGPALAGVPATAKIEAIRSGLAEERLSAMQDRVGALLDVGRDREAAAELAVLLADHPLSEGLAGMLMVALYRGGRQADALQAFRDLRRRLAGELAVEPGPELQRLHQRILAGDPGLAAPARGPVEAAAPPAPGGRPTAGGDGRLVVPRQLPAAVAHFVGRANELRVLSGLIGQAGRAGGTVVVSAIGGMAGVGKTALAVHWAHQVAGRFPDGQLYVNMRAFGPSGKPVTAHEAVRGFLDALAVPPDRIPAGLDAQAALYRSVVAGKRMLVVLDNAGSEEQVRPLLPGTPGCMVVVTSRSQLPGLAAIEGVRPLTLDVMSEAEAGELLACRLGAGRVTGEREAVSELARLCAWLPLALAVAAARAADRPGLALAELAGQLRDRRKRLDLLETLDPASSVRAVFSWSCQGLSSQAARMFRLLGIHPGPDITAAAAASLAGIPPAQAIRVLGELTGAHLLTEQIPGRFAFHDLLRAYATEKAQAEDGRAERRTAMHRVFDHYLHTAWPAAQLLHPGRDPAFVLAPPQPGTRPESIRDGGHALAWCRAEHQVLLAVITQAAGARFDAYAWRLPWALTDYFRRTGCWPDLAATQRTALAAARRLDDRAGQARAHHGLGQARLLACPGKATHDHLAQALSLYQELGDLAGQACIHHAFSAMFELQRRPQTALSHGRQMLSLARASGRRGEEAHALNAIGWLHAQLGDTQRALACCRQALRLHRHLNDRSGEAVTWDSLGYIRHRLGQLPQAITCYQHAIRLYRELGNRYHQAICLDHLGDAQDAASDPQAARTTWRQALAILDGLHHPDASQVRRKLRDCGVNHPSPSLPRSSPQNSR